MARIHVNKPTMNFFHITIQVNDLDNHRPETKNSTCGKYQKQTEEKLAPGNSFWIFKKKNLIFLFFRDFLERVEACLIEKVLINSI